MVLGIHCFRESPDPGVPGPEQVREVQRQRFKDLGLVDTVIAADQGWTFCRGLQDKLNFLANTISKLIGARMKAKAPMDGADEVSDEVFQQLVTLACNRETKLPDLQAALERFTVKQLRLMSGTLVKRAQAENETKMQALDEERNAKRRLIGNFLHETVPVFQDEEHNKIERTVGPVGDTNRKKYSHVDLIEMIGGVDFKRGTAVAGGRGYFLKGPGVALEQALVNYAQQFLLDRECQFLSPPLFVRKEVMSEVAQLSQFAEELYKVAGKGSEREDDTTVDEKFLIATSEQPIASFHRGEHIDPKVLPLRYAGISECFRQEVGSHGRDTRGIFRVHQFKKIEQFFITSPHDGESWKLMDEMIANAEGFTQSIGLSYQIVNIVSGALNLAAAKKLDLEAWFPGQGTFRELVSCSNCTDYQSRRLNIMHGVSRNMHTDLPDYVHMLNSTLCATTRMICCILESFQVGDFDPTGKDNGGVVVPEVLRPYMPRQFREFIPFVAAPPVLEEEAAAVASKKDKPAKEGK